MSLRQKEEQTNQEFALQVEKAGRAYLPSLPEPDLQLNLLEVFQKGLRDRSVAAEICFLPIKTFSCWPVAVPLKTQHALEITEKLIENVFSVYGCPLAIHSDKGRSFENELLKNVMALYGINKTCLLYTSPSPRD